MQATELIKPDNSNRKNLLIALRLIRDNPKYRNGSYGICAAVSLLTEHLPHGCFKGIALHLSTLLKEWPKGTGCNAFPIPGKGSLNFVPSISSYENASTQRKMWTRSTRYGALRWELLHWLIEQCESNINKKSSK